MPEPRAGEPQDKFLNRCVPVLIREGREQRQAVAICGAMWRRARSRRAARSRRE